MEKTREERAAGRRFSQLCWPLYPIMTGAQVETPAPTMR
jgi:hypothetical protein